MTLYQELRGANPEAITQVEELVATLAIAKAVKAEFDANSSLVETPEWLDDKIRSLGRELKAKTADVLEKRLKEAQARREGLKTSEEKRRDLDAEIARLNELRGKVGV